MPSNLKTEHSYWHRQTRDEPLFPDILWERPQRRDQAGKLLIAGGSSQGILAPSEAYAAASDAGIGEAKVFVPETLRKLTKSVPHIVYGEANDIGSFSSKAQETLLFAAQWADGVLLAGDFGRNSETSILFAHFIHNYRALTTITKDAIELLHSECKLIANRPQTLLVLSFSQLQKFATDIGESSAFVYTMDFMRLVDQLHDLTTRYPVMILTKHHSQLIAATGGQVATTERSDLDEEELWRVATAAKATVHLLHHLNQQFEALACSLL